MTLQERSLLIACASWIGQSNSITGLTQQLAVEEIRRLMREMTLQSLEVPKPPTTPEYNKYEEDAERNERVRERYFELTRVISARFYEVLFRIVQEEVERTDKADDIDTETVIEDNDKKMDEIHTQVNALQSASKEIELLKQEIKLLRIACNAIMVAENYDDIEAVKELAQQALAVGPVTPGSVQRENNLEGE